MHSCIVPVFKIIYCLNRSFEPIHTSPVEVRVEEADFQYQNREQLETPLTSKVEHYL
jgi:hypothetical protein